MPGLHLCQQSSFTFLRTQTKTIHKLQNYKNYKNKIFVLQNDHPRRRQRRGVLIQTTFVVSLRTSTQP